MPKGFPGSGKKPEINVQVGRAATGPPVGTPMPCTVWTGAER